jgi:hypothetical protein
VLVHRPIGIREPHAVDDAAMVQLVAHYQITLADELRDQPRYGEPVW